MKMRRPIRDTYLVDFTRADLGDANLPGKRILLLGNQTILKVDTQDSPGP